MWSSDEQPPALIIDGSPQGVLIGVGQGAIARYRLGTVEGNPLEAVWDPTSPETGRAIGYASVDDRTAVVLADGSIVLLDESPDETTTVDTVDSNDPASTGRTTSQISIWDPALTELRAIVVEGSDGQVTVLLETGSVVRIPLQPGAPIESVWDITDETLEQANQVAVEPVGPSS